MLHPVSNHYLFKKSEFETDKRFREEKEKKAAEKRNKKILCKYCKNHVTDVNEAILVNDSHTHTFTNPAGYVYAINCYQTAVGCLVAGVRTSEYSWFAGYYWQIAFCNSCTEQMGWSFTNGQQFYALIADRLIQEESAD